MSEIVEIAKAEIIDAWNDNNDRVWFSRYNKMIDVKIGQYEVIEDWGGEVVSDETRLVVGNFHSQDEADNEVKRLKNDAAADRVLKAITTVRHDCFKRLIRFT